MRQLFTSGDIVVHVAAAGIERVQLIFIPRSQGNQFFEYPYFNSSTADDRRPKAEMEQYLLTESEKPIHYIYKFLKENGASYFSDIENSSGLSVRQIVLVLQDLIKRSLVSCDDYSTFLTVLSFDSDSAMVETAAGSNKPFAYNPRSKMSGRREIQQRVKANIQLKSGRWFLTSSFAVSGKSLSVEEKVERQARLLLNRHGILIKEWYRLENGLVPWYQIFQVLKKLEWQGEIVRGYFIEGLSGIQYALPHAITLLERIVAHEQAPPPSTLLSTLDPAVPLGRNIEWDLFDQHKNKVAITKSPGNHLFFMNGKAVMYMENYAARLLCLDDFTPLALPLLVQQLKIRLLLPAELRPRKRLEIENINSIPAGESEWAAEFIKLGFEQDDKKLILWPSQAT
jgi:ATP-dependent Lhr-like helicase